MKTKTRMVALSVGLLLGMAIISQSHIASAATDFSQAPDTDRNLFVSAELWSKYRYNRTEADEAAVIALGGSYSPMVDKLINDTIPAGFRSTSAGLEDGIVSDLNITGGIKYSGDIFNNFVTEPVQYAPSSATALARQLSLINEHEIGAFNDEVPVQFFNHETKELDQVQTDIASSIKRTWTGSEVNVTHTYLRIGVSFDQYKILIDLIEGDSKWDAVDGMTNAQIISVLDDYVPTYTLGMGVMYGNITALNAETGKTNWDLSNELVATLDNKTDTRLSQYDSESAFVTHGVLGYIMEFGITDTTTSMVANGLYGPVYAEEWGRFKGLEIGYTPAQDSFTDEDETTIFVWYDVFDGVVNAAKDFGSGISILLSNIVPFIEAKEPTEDVPYALAFLLSLAIMFIVMLWQGDGRIDKYMKKARKGDADAWKMMAFTFLAFIIPLVLILNTYQNWF